VEYFGRNFGGPCLIATRTEKGGVSGMIEREGRVISYRVQRANKIGDSTLDSLEVTGKRRGGEKEAFLVTDSCNKRREEGGWWSGVTGLRDILGGENKPRSKTQRQHRRGDAKVFVGNLWKSGKVCSRTFKDHESLRERRGPAQEIL